MSLIRLRRNKSRKSVDTTSAAGQIDTRSQPPEHKAKERTSTPDFSAHSTQAPYTSRRRRETSSSQDMSSEVYSLNDLVGDIEIKMEATGNSFLSDSELTKLIYPQAVRSILKSELEDRFVDGMTEFFSGQALKVFAILAYNNYLKVAAHMYRIKFCDDMLPVEYQKTSKGPEVRSYKKDANELVREAFRHGQVKDPWGKWQKPVKDFCQFWQWPFVPPVFVKDTFRYQFPDGMQLPFTKSGGKKNEDPTSTNYSYVEEKSVHIDHIPQDLELPVDEQKNPRVAIKALKPLANIKSVAEGEADVLEMIRGSQSEHLVKAIAYYQKGNDHYFMFPWAEMGNLSEFLRGTYPKTDRENIIWLLRQLVGLADAIEELHHYMVEEDNNPEPSIRHGDMKPENILCFKSKDGGKDTPRLVISDVGLAKIHNKATELRSRTAPTAATKRYEAPELGINPNTPKSRRFDIWSLGCIYLEVIIWLLYGPKKLQAFADAESPFYDIEGIQSLSLRVPGRSEGTARVHPKVTKWITYIREEDWRCAHETAVQRLIDLITNRLLVVSLGDDKSSAGKTHGRSSIFSRLGTPPMEPLFEEPSTIEENSIAPGKPSEMQALEGQRPAVTIRKASTRSSEPKPGLSKRATWSENNSEMASRDARAYATETKRELIAILGDLDSRRIKAIGERPLGVTSTPEGPKVSREDTISQGHSPTWRQNDYRYTPLNDDWDYTPDDDIPQRIFAKIDSNAILPQPYELSRLCSRCSGLQLWSMECTFLDSLEGLVEKAEKNGCSLCGLLSQDLLRQSRNRRDIFRFARVSSYITIDDGKCHAMANIYSMPGPPQATQQNFQIGFPKLSHAGSATHIECLKEWIRHCDETHHCYPRDIDFVPTRLLDVSGESKTIRLLDNGQSHAGSAAYAALSHRWGSPAQQAAQFCTFKSNVEEFKRGIEIARLPKTFQDAIYVSRAIRLQCLWIDSLCIVQDDPDDWSTESKFMERVFSSAYCTIAASCANSSSDGFFKPRSERTCVTMSGPGEGETYYVCETIDDFHRDVEQNELNQRGWVLQERALSRRTIYFTEPQSYWECGEGVRCETMTKMKNRKASFLGDANFPTLAESYVKGMKIELFQDLYKRYSGLALSYLSDKPIAIRGLESRLLTTFKTTGGYGILDKFLHRSLLWQRSKESLERILTPSWSFMAHSGPIEYLSVPFGEASWSDDITSPFSKGKQPAVISRSQVNRGDLKASILELGAPVWEIAHMRGGNLILDNPHYHYAQPLQCVIIGKNTTQPLDEHQAHYVLLVHRVAGVDEGRAYERVGVGVLERHQIALERGQKQGKIR